MLQLDASEYDGFGDILSQNLHQPLQNQDVLPRLAHIQSALDPIDIEGLRHIIKDTTGVDLAASQADQAFLSQCHEANLGGEPTVQELEFLAKLLIESGPSPYVVRQLSVRHRIVAYLLSAAFKDCSLFVRLDFPNRLLSQPVISLKIVDVDLKSICRLPHYFALDQLLADPNMCLKACTGNDAAHIRAMPP